MRILAEVPREGRQCQTTANLQCMANFNVRLFTLWTCAMVTPTGPFSQSSIRRYFLVNRTLCEFEWKKWNV